ncbi:MAG: hypothetical protein QE487_19030 [Fluviicola sp.]|nr:hypothetical protein [Fluviicola sp.]
MFKSNLLFGTSKQLTVSKEFIELTKAGKTDEKSIRFDKADIVAYRFGIKWISGYAFTIGREYHIFVKDKADREMKISLQSLYGFKKAETSKHYSQIIRSMAEYYLKEIVEDYLQQFSEGKPITICGVQLTETDVTIETKNRLINKKIAIPWQNVGIKGYHTYFAIFSDENPTDINRSYYYLEEWNVGILFAVMEPLINQFSEVN